MIIMIGDVILNLRKENNMTQAQLGKELNVTYQAVSKWENNVSSPDFDTIIKMSKLFNVSLEVFALETQDDKVQEEIPIIVYKKEIEVKKNYIIPIIVFINIIIAMVCIEIGYIQNLFLSIPITIVTSLSITLYSYYIYFDIDLKNKYQKSIYLLFYLTNLIDTKIKFLSILKPLTLMLGFIGHIFYFIYLLVYSLIKFGKGLVINNGN